MSAARLAAPAEVGEFAAEMRGRHVALHSFAVGPQTDLEMLGTLAQQTGGIVLIAPLGSAQSDRGRAGGCRENSNSLSDAIFDQWPKCRAAASHRLASA